MPRRLDFSVDPRLLQNFGRAQYSHDPLMIVPRELGQNAQDACRAKGVDPHIVITIRVIKEGDLKGTRIVCEDNGIGMDEDVIVDKLLNLGGTTKTNNTYGATGSFGVAKAAIMSCDEWTIESLDNIFNKQMFEAHDEIGKQEPIDGTRITVYIKDKTYVSYALGILAMSQIEGLTVDCEDGWGARVYDENYGMHSLPEKVDEVSEFGTVYVCEAIPYSPTQVITGYNIVRINGLAQFHWYSNRDTNLIFEVDDQSYRPYDEEYPFPMNREELRPKYKEFFAGRVRFHDENSITSKMMLKKDPIDKKVNGETKLFNRENLMFGERDELSEKQSWLTEPKRNTPVFEPSYATMDFDLMELTTTAAKKRNRPPQEIAFVLKDSYVQNKSKKLLRLAFREIWTRLIQICADRDDNFGVGFFMDEYGELANRDQVDGMTFYCLNIKRFEEIHISTPQGIVEFLYHVAVHETAHFKHYSHDERFSSEMILINMCSSDRFSDIKPELVGKLRRAKR